MSGTKCWCGGKVDKGLSGVNEIDVCRESEFHDPFSDGRPKAITTLYVAGPMSGYPESNYPEFNRASARLRAAGFEVVNPAEIHLERCHYVDLIREDLREMLDCHGVATLDNWWESPGARNEVSCAGLLRMPVRPWVEWVNNFVPQ